jgi:sugar/nucleoside kinase (ribokinase family)
VVDVAFVGHFARDRLIYRGTTENASGGGVYYGSMAVRRLGYSAAVITKLHPDDFERLEELRHEGIEVHASPAPQTTGIENIYPTEDMDRRICRPLGFAGPFSLDEIPRVDARVTVITPLMAGEVDGDIVRALISRGPVGLDVQGFVRVRQSDGLVTKDWPGKTTGLAGVTYLKVDDAEAEVLTGETDRRKAAAALAALGPREILVTSARGVLAHASGECFEAPFVNRSVIGRTGRGDTCFSTYVASRLRLSPGEACRVAAAVTSLKMEQPGPYRGTREDAERLAAVAGLLGPHPKDSE